MVENVDIIGHLMGNWGRWQLRSVLLIYLSKIPAAWFMACIIFTAKYAEDGEYHCRPLVDNINIKNHTEWIIMSHPILTDGSTNIENANNKKKYDYCNIYSDQEKTIDNYYHYLNNETNAFNLTNIIQENKIPCQEFVHHSKYKYTSMVPEFDLVCSRKMLIAVSQFFHLFGVLLGGIIATKLLEYISPRYVMFYGMALQIITGCATGLVSNFNLHMILRCVAAICCALIYTAGQVIFTDITGGRYRTTALCLFDSFWSIGVIMLPGVSYLFPNWTNMYLAISLPTCAYIILWFWIPNSPRWLLRKGLIEDTRTVLIQSLKTNDREHLLPVDLNERLNIQSTILLNETKPVGWLSLWDTPKSIIYMIALHIAWAIYVTNFNGMLLNVRAFGRDYLTVNTIVTGIFEILGVTIGLIIIFKATRKWMWAGIFSIFAGFITCSGLLMPDNTSDTTRNVFYMILAMICKTAISCSQAILVTCSSELVSPEKRKICLYSCIVWARIWLLTAPFIGVLSQIHQVLGLVAFGILTTVGGLATCILISPKTIPSNKTKPLNLPSPTIAKEGVWLIEKN